MNKIEAAQDHLGTMWRENVGLQTSPSHPDYFAENLDLYVAAHLAMDKPDRALQEFYIAKQATFPQSRFAAHYMLGSHERFGVETKAFDALHQRVIELPSGQKVTPLAAPPNRGIAAEQIANYLSNTIPEKKAAAWVAREFEDLCNVSKALYDERSAAMIGGLICQAHVDELTFRDGILANRAKGNSTVTVSAGESIDMLNYARIELGKEVTEPSEKKRLSRKLPRWNFTPVIDVGINSLMAANNEALKRLATKYGLGIPDELWYHMEKTEHALAALVNAESGFAESHTADLRPIYNQPKDPESKSYSIESFLAAARAPEYFDDGTSWAASALQQLVEEGHMVVPTFFRYENDKYKVNNAVGEGAISPTHNLELARRFFAHNYDSQNLEVARLLGESTMKLLEGSEGFPRSFDPVTGEANLGGNALTRRFFSKQELWTPTAAAIVASEPLGILG
ncbi:MAG: hypothetical protein AAB436_02895 [Patescibacteria group bacterium]